MDSSARRPLSAIQVELLDALFAAETGFYLSGGAALAGFFLHHRPTDDLDLFTADRAIFERGRAVLRQAAERIGARLDLRQDAPGFVRAFVSRRGEGVVVDLVYEPVPQRVSEKPVVDGVRVDPPEEIVANKLAALAGRSEVRDLVDLAALEDAGYLVEPALAAALAKDGGATPAAIAWSVAHVKIDDQAPLAGATSPDRLRAYRDALVTRLRKAGFPES